MALLNSEGRIPLSRISKKNSRSHFRVSSLLLTRNSGCILSKRVVFPIFVVSVQFLYLRGPEYFKVPGVAALEWARDKLVIGFINQMQKFSSDLGVDLTKGI